MIVIFSLSDERQEPIKPIKPSNRLLMSAKNFCNQPFGLFSTKMDANSQASFSKFWLDMCFRI